MPFSSLADVLGFRFRHLGSGQAVAYEQLCQIFHTETNCRTDMTRHNKLLAVPIQENRYSQ